MGRKKTPGLIKRAGIWHIDKQIRGSRICESTGESDLVKAEEYLAKRINEIRQAVVFGTRPRRTFRQAATKYLSETTKVSIAEDAMHLKMLDSYIGDLYLNKIHIGTLQQFIADRHAHGVKTRTINYALQCVRRILYLSAGEWLDENGLTWLETAPSIKFLPENDRRKPYPISWEEQSRLFKELPAHLATMALFKINTGCREHEVCTLKWEWEIKIPELNYSVFLIPAENVKNRQDRLVVLNKVALSVVEKMRRIHPIYVFTYKDNPILKMNGHAWRKARQRANLPLVRVHDMKHTFGRRLRAAGVSFEDRQDLLGHKSGRITTLYSSAELTNLIDSANKICEDDSRKSPALVILRHVAAND